MRTTTLAALFVLYPGLAATAEQRREPAPKPEPWVWLSGADFDESAGKMKLRRYDKPVLEIPCDRIRKVIVEPLPRGESPGVLMPWVDAVRRAYPGGAVDRIVYIEYASSEGRTQRCLTEVGKNTANQFILKGARALGERLSAPNPPLAMDVAKESLPDFHSKHSFRKDKKNRPVPQVRSDKALVVVLCPSIRGQAPLGQTQLKLHVNDRVVAINKGNTYSFFHIDPGEYMFTSQGENARGIRLRVEAGQEYYFFQSAYRGFARAKSELTLHSKEIATCLLERAAHAVFARKE